MVDFFLHWGTPIFFLIIAIRLMGGPSKRAIPRPGRRRVWLWLWIAAKKGMRL